MPAYEAQFLQPPIPAADPPKAFNSSFAGILHDNNNEIYKGLFRNFVQKTNEQILPWEMEEQFAKTENVFLQRPNTYFPNLI